jgi:phosphate starvation-inducible protein PhoH and related proteins
VTIENSRVQIDVTQVSMLSLLGTDDKLLKTLENAFPKVEVLARGNKLTFSGPTADVERAKNLIEEMILLISDGQQLAPQDVTRSAKIIDEANLRPTDVLSQSILSSRGKSIRPKTLGQKLYVDSIDQNTIVFGVGPAGTGKTYLAMAKAVQALQRKEVSRIILTRPAVEAGERLGFLPGTLNDKIDPYLRPLFDALHEMLDPESVPKLLASGTIEVAPLAYMRGRTLNDAFIILDEAQNTTPEQMKMFLTRLGFNSKMVVTGDVTQIDLPNGTSGLRTALEVLGEVDDMSVSFLTSDDVVRHSLVAKIIDAYSKFEETRGRK